MAGGLSPASDRAKHLGYFNAARSLFGMGLPPLLIGGCVPDYFKNTNAARRLSERQALIVSLKETFMIALVVASIGFLLWILILLRKGFSQANSSANDIDDGS